MHTGSKTSRWLSSVSELEAGDHACCLYHTQAERNALLGLQPIQPANETAVCLVFTSDDDLLSHVADLPGNFKSFDLRGDPDIYVEEKLESLVTLCRQETAAARQEGFSRVHILCEPPFDNKKVDSPCELLRFEALLDSFLGENTASCICLYDQNYYSSTMLNHVLEVHPVVVSHDHAHRNLYYLPPGNDLPESLSRLVLSRRFTALEEMHTYRKALDAEAGQHITVLNRSCIDGQSSSPGILQLHDLIGSQYPNAPAIEAELRPVWEKRVSEAFSTGKPIQSEFQFLCGSKERVYHWCLLPEFDVNHGVHQVLSVTRDISSERLAQAEYQNLFNQMLDGFALHEIICDQDNNPIDYRFLDINPAFERMTGLERDKIVGRTVLEVLPNTEKHWIETYGKVALTGEPYRFSNFSAELGKNFEVIAFRPRPLQFACIFQDITDRVNLEEQLRHAQKMEAIGTLAGGIAHDFNNLLQAMMSYSSLIERELPEDASCKKWMSNLSAAQDRARDLVSQILAFSRQDQQSYDYIRVQDIIEEVSSFLENAVPSTIHIQTDIGDDCRTIYADAGQIQQVIMNLTTNSYQAMEDKGGTITLSLSESLVNEDADSRLHHLPKGNYACLVVSDNGPGIPASQVQKVFDPFFTTKEVGKGTGLGLSLVHGIVKSHEGGILLDSEPGKGTNVSVYLPINEPTAEFDQTAKPDEEQTNTELTASILLVDDEELGLLPIKVQLEQSGYQVNSFTSPQEALEFYEASPDAYDLLITDLTMPEMTGTDLVEAVHAITPSLPVILCSGFTDRMLDENWAQRNIQTTVSKPYKIADLKAAIAHALNG